MSSFRRDNVEQEHSNASVASSARPQLVAADATGVLGQNELSAKTAQNFAMALHELATNAAKHGALSNTTGHVHVCWELASSSDGPTFSFTWQEQGGPPVAPPARKGFGPAVLEQIMGEYLGPCPQMSFGQDGFSYTLQGPLVAIAA